MNEHWQQILERWLFDPLTGQFLAAILGIVFIAIAVRVLRRVISRRIVSDTIRYQARKSVSFAGYVVAFIFVTLVFADRLGGFTVAFGVAGAGVAFALQEVIASIAGWIAIIFGGVYKVGDRVRLGGIKGDVIDIATLRTTIMEMGEWVNADQYNGRIVRVANSFVLKEPVFNYSSQFPFLWDELMIPIKYGSDYHLARDLLERVAEEVVGDYARSAEKAWEPFTQRYHVEKARVLPLVTMTANHDWIELSLRYVVHYKERRTTKDRLFLRILEEIDKSDGKVGIAASTLNVEKMPPVEVHLSRS